MNLIMLQFCKMYFAILQSAVKKEEEIAAKEIKEEVDDLSDEKRKDKKVKKEKKENKKAKKNKQAAGPMHFTANNEPRAVDVLGELDPKIFDEVKIFYYIYFFKLNILYFKQYEIYNK